MAEEQEKPEGAGGSKKKLFIIIGAAAAVVIVAVVAVLMLGGGKKEPTKEGAAGAHGEAKKEEAKPAAGGHGGGGGGGEAGKGGGAANIHAMDPFIVNIYDGQELRYLKVKVEFELAAPEAKAELEGKQSQLKDAILILLTTKTLQDIQDLNGKNQLRDEILAAANKIIPPGKISKVYFTDFVVQ
jgi:flagellar FliL protein